MRRSINEKTSGTARDSPTLAQVVRDRRKELGVSQQVIADRFGLTSAEYIGLIENGVRNPDLRKIPSLARALELNERDLTLVALFQYAPQAYYAIFGVGKPRVIAVGGRNEVLERPDVSREILGMLTDLDPEDQLLIKSLVERIKVGARGTNPREKARRGRLQAPEPVVTPVIVSADDFEPLNNTDVTEVSALVQKKNNAVLREQEQAVTSLPIKPAPTGKAGSDIEGLRPKND